jgi:hypothetical protein
MVWTSIESLYGGRGDCFASNEFGQGNVNADVASTVKDGRWITEIVFVM